jgi:hypothetical protein
MPMALTSKWEEVSTGWFMNWFSAMADRAMILVLDNVIFLTKARSLRARAA